MDNIKPGLHTVEQIAPNTYRIDENGAVNCYLAVGKERALLIDTGCDRFCDSSKGGRKKINDICIC
ncbi:hypothetical protein [Clostridium sp. CF012]|uniref:hypothetical protein n=1 Tax=Clostridium sp. CF012 TaxID=2843319 RepID=UPI001C0B7FC6|nr:hypothetical protein [Clostridium sp. CF012]MBU3145830.1 hypothetical protein [Clostridium sp. CF012]